MSTAAGGALPPSEPPAGPALPRRSVCAPRVPSSSHRRPHTRRRRTMSFRSILARRRSASTWPRSRAAGRPRRAVLAVEPLADRTLPSTFTVSNLADAGDGSLRQAVLDANSPAYPGADVINFTAGLQGTIALGGVPLSITDQLTIEGPGAELVAVSGEDASRVFEIGEGVIAVLDGLTITRGQAENGGGIYNAGTLTVSHCTLSANQAVGGAGHDARGGGICNEAPAVLTVTHSLFSDNRAVGGDGGPGVHGGEGAGGGIYNLDASLTISNCTFTGNQAFGGNGGGAGGGIANGGALASEGIGGPAFLSVSHSTLSGNQATGGFGGVFATEDSDGHGGAVFNRGLTTFFLSHSTVADNRATGGAGATGRVGGNGNGGGLLLSVTGVGPTSIQIDSCAFTGNEATGGAGGAGASGGIGQAGALRTSTRLTVSNPRGSLVVGRCTFIGNQATGGAGGAGATGGIGQGGAYQTIGANWTINFSRSTFFDNQATGGAGGAGGNGGLGRGGGCIFSNFSTVNLDHVDVTGNQATGGTEGAGGKDGQGIGGGVYIFGNSLVSARYTDISGNHASTSNDDVFGPIDFGA